MDDERHTFHPVLWDESQEAKLVAENKVEAGRIEQVWFPGVHSDVGGGYSKHTLALVALDWMISKVETDPDSPGGPGLKLIPERRREFHSHSDWFGPQHDSRSGVAAYYRYKPREIGDLCNDEKNGVFVEKPKIHRSVLERIRSSAFPYAPTALPKDYEVVATRGTPPIFETEAEASKRAEAMGAARKLIFRRRGLYLALLLTTWSLLMAPIFLAWNEGGGCVGSACLVDPLLQWAIDALPGFAARWFYALSQNPVWLWGYVLVFSVLFWLKGRWLSKTQEYAMAAWAKLRTSGSDA